MSRLLLLAGPELASGAERLHSHIARLGPPPMVGRSFIDVLDRTGLTGRGGAAFPVGRKWRAIAAAGAAPVVIANGAEGEPQSLKDRVLMSTRPHLVLDGALIAARALRASQVALYVGEEHRAAWAAMAAALGERPEPELRRARLVAAPQRYVAGEASAAVNLVGTSIALPTTKPPSAHESGVGGAPTLVQNVETLAAIALAARGMGASTMLVTVAGAVRAPGVVEIEAGTSVRALLEGTGVDPSSRAVLLGGYFGSWVDFAPAQDLALDARSLRQIGLGIGCGVIGVLSAGSCGVCETARIMRYLAGESSAQCGPCFFGLRALADACSRIAERGTNQDDLARLHRWSAEVQGRGACHHPDGAVLFLQSALRTFTHEFAAHPAHWRAHSTRSGVA